MRQIGTLLRVLTITTAAAVLGGCYYYAPPPPHAGRVWVPGHFGPAGYWIPGHWNG